MSARARQLAFYFLAVACMAAASGGYDSVMNNYLSSAYDVSEVVRGRLEFPRELPGLLVAGMTGLLCMLPVTHLAVVGSVVLAAGMAGILLLTKKKGAEPWIPRELASGRTL